MLTLQNLSKQFGHKKAVDGVSFSIKKGEIFTLIGPNSAGKSTIVKSIVGLLETKKGSISVDGNDISDRNQKAKELIGYIPDEPALWPSMTGKEFLFFTQALYKVPEKERLSSLPKLLEIFHLSGLENEYFENYSRGNKQKFSITAALSHKPKLLIVDEPIVGLDPEGAETAKKLFVDFVKNGGSLLLVTHTLSVATEISDRIGFLKEGRLVALGTLTELRKAANLEENATLDEIYRYFA
jgi:ABC-2 type transport system ATP-binding protein